AWARRAAALVSNRQVLNEFFQKMAMASRAVARGLSKSLYGEAK
ncbi:hypothetical protein PR002_g33038, partial [Phytophthora rubi]